MKQTSINAICPWSGDPVSEDSLTEYRGHIVGFCNPGCRDKFEKARDMFDEAIAKLS
jgi:YHS domain-containing protein